MENFRLLCKSSTANTGKPGNVGKWPNFLPETSLYPLTLVSYSPSQCPHPALPIIVSPQAHRPLTDGSFPGSRDRRPFPVQIHGLRHYQASLPQHSSEWMDPQPPEWNPKSDSSWHRPTQLPIPLTVHPGQVHILSPTWIDHHLTISSHIYPVWGFSGKISLAYNSSFNTPTSFHPTKASRNSSWATQQNLA